MQQRELLALNGFYISNYCCDVTAVRNVEDGFMAVVWRSLDRKRAGTDLYESRNPNILMRKSFG